MSTTRNVLLETGYTRHDSGAVSTQTALFTIHSEDGLITSLEQQAATTSVAAGEYDARGLLGIPPTKDLHIHLDKGHFGGPWQAVVPAPNGVPDRILEEQRFLPAFLEFLPERAGALLEHIAAGGTTFMRVQVNVDPTIGLQNYEVVRDVLAAHAPRVQSELVAFPQHGTLVTEAQGLLTQAMEAGVPILGGLDPASIDGDIEGSLTTTFELASRFDREVDIHLHDGGETGIHTIQRIIDYTREYGMAGRVAISHALALGFASDEQLTRLAEGLAAQGVSIFTTQPLSYASTFGARAVPWPILKAAGVRVCMINDNINDHWSPFGSGDLIERVSRAAEIWRQVDEIGLANAYTLVSDGVLPLNDAGEMLWPKTGDEATILLTNASCLSEVVARVPKERVMMFRGEIDRLPAVARGNAGGTRSLRTQE